MRFAVGHADQHESPAADVSRGRMHNRQRESDSDGRIHGIAAGLENIHSHLRGQRVHGDHHRVLRAHGMSRGRSGGRDGDEN